MGSERVKPPATFKNQSRLLNRHTFKHYGAVRPFCYRNIVLQCSTRTYEEIHGVLFAPSIPSDACATET